MKTWFTADTHFGHANIIEYSSRPFKSVEHMNKELIRRWNERVGKNDIVIFLGDFCFKSGSGRGKGINNNAVHYLNQLNGYITFIKGNHDNNNSLNTRILNLSIIIAQETMFCVHFPQNYCADYNINLVGHIHEKWKIQRRRSILVNVGVDQWDYHPIDINEILKAISRFKIKEREK